MALLFVPVGSLLLTPASRGLKALALAAILLAAPAIVLTGTRGAVLTVGISSLLFAWFTWRRGWLPRRAVVLGLSLAILAAAPLAKLVWARVVQGDGGSAIARVHLSKIAVAIIQDHLLFGVGAGNCYRAMLPYANSGEFRAEWLYTIHSKFLLVWVETGLFGLLAFLSFLFTMLGKGWAAWHSDERLIAILSLAFAVTLLGQLPHMAMDVFNSRPQVQMLWCCAGIVAALYRMDGFATLRDVRVGELGHVV
jgi:O-antigen ligase